MSELNKILRVKIGGIKHAVHIRTEDTNLPVLLFLHGGPGVPTRHSLQRRPALADHFTVVHYDQRGVGGSYWGARTRDMTIARLTDDAAELVDWLCGKFQKDKIFIMGGSWGTMLGTFLVYRYPEKIAAYLGYGQMANGVENERLGYEFALEQAQNAGDKESTDKLLAIGAPVNGVYKGGVRSMLIQRSIMTKYGGMSPSKDKKKRSLIESFVKPILRSKEYTFTDIIGLLLGYRMAAAMYVEVTGTDLAAECPQFKVPYFIFDGRLDYTTPASLIEDYFEKIKAPRKELHWFENSGHSPSSDEPEKFLALTLEKFGEVFEENRKAGIRV